MKPAVLFLTVLGCVAAIPSGSYHTEYNYKTHSSAYKNNELQHQTDDQGYYRKDGDLEGRVRPRVDANSEHSEYVNPNLRNSEFNTGLIGGANGDMSSYGHMRADIGGYGNHDLSSEGLARVDHLTGSRGAAYSGYSSGSYGSNSYGSYGMSSNLRSLTSHLQQDLERDLQEAIQENRAYAQSTVGTQELERQLRQNLTDRLNNELAKTYGQQSIRGGLSYTISGGRLHSTANYDNQELEDLRSQIENSLLNQLRRAHQTARYETHQSSHGNYDYSATTVRPVYYTHNPVPVFRPVTTIRPSYSDNYVRYTPISNPPSLTTIASSVQNQLDTRLNELLEDAQRRYFSSSSSYSLTNADVVLENLRNELRSNITYMLNENVKMNFGQQIPRDGYMYSVGPNGQTSSQYNYAIHDLENLRSQIERNLIEKLNRDFERYRSRWYQQSSRSQSTHNSNQYGAYNTPRYETYSTPLFRPYDSEVEPISATPASSHITSLIGSGSTSSSNRHYEHMAGSRVSGYEIGGASGSSNVAQLQRQLQQDLSRQLQAAISRSHYRSYSSSGSYNPQSYQLSLQQLQNELNRNLTRQLQEYSASGSYSAYGNIDQAQLASLRNQLQTDLMRQLQQGLQQSYQASSSFSSSSSSNYRSARGFDNYQAGQYRSGGGVYATEEDCVGDDPNAYSNQRLKRSYTPYRSQTIGLSNSGNYRNNGGYNPNYDYSSPHRTHYGGNQQREQELGQQVDESDLTQQVEDVGFDNLQQGPQQQVGLGQQVDNSDLTQQVDSSSIGKLQQISQGQEVDESDLTQQVEDANFGRLQLGSQSQHTQQVDDSDLTQQVEDSSFERLQLGSHNQLGQQVDNSENHQVEDSNFGRLQLGSQSQQNQQVQQVDPSDLTQQVEDSNFGKLLLGSQSLQSQQQIDVSDLTQQVEDSNYGKLQLGSQIQPIDNQGQQIDDSDLTQQVQDPNFGRLQLGSQNQLMEQRQDDRDLDLTQQVQNSNFEKLQLGSHGQRRLDLGQQVHNTDLTQQVEEVQYGKLHLDSQSQSQVDDTDLTQQVQILQGKPQLGSHNQLQEPLGQEVDNSDLTQQAEDIHSGNTGLQPGQYNYYGVGRLHNQNQQQIQHSNLYIGGQRQKPEFGQREDSPDLTQQLDGSFAGEMESGSQQGFALQGQQQTSFGRQQFSEIKPYEINFLKKNFDQTQRQIVYKLENQLSKEVEDAVKNYYANSYSGLHNYQYTYTNLLRELERNITKQLQAIGPNSGSTSYSYSYSFSGPQVDSLRKYLETDLKLQLQEKLSGSANFKQEQTDQEQSNINSNFQIQSNGFDSQRTSPSSNLELVQQQQNGFENTEQQQSGLGQEFSDVTNAVGSNNGRLQLGNQPIRHPSINDQDDLTQQIDTPFDNPTLAGQQQIVQPTDQLQQIEEVSPQSTPAEFNPNQRGHYHYSGSHSSGTYQYSSRFRNRKPTTDSNAFLNTEISQQQNLYQSQGVISQPSQFPTLNQVIQNQQHEADEVHSNKIEQQSTISNITQQETEFTDGQQQENIELFPHGTAISQDENQVGKQSLAVAEHDANMLIQALQNHVAQSTPRQEVTNRPLSYAQVLSQDNSGNSGTTQHQKSFQNFLNSQQVELAYQVENDVSKQLQDAISDNYYMISHSTHTSNPQLLFQVNYEQLLEDLRRNITIQCDQIFQGSGQSGYSSYSSYNKNSLTQEQREKLVRELQAELSKQLEHNLQISYGIQQYNDGHSSRVTYSSSPRGASSPYGSAAIYTSYGSSMTDHGSQTNQLHYGQQEEIPGAETVSSLQQVKPQRPYSVIHNVDPQVPSNSNIGVKGSRRPTPVLTPVQDTVHEPQVELVTPVQVNGAEEVADLNQENLPWWKRVGNKIKQGASNLKEKIIG